MKTITATNPFVPLPGSCRMQPANRCQLCGVRFLPGDKTLMVQIFPAMSLCENCTPKEGERA